ncbi:MAG TPA: cation:proton antiporter, partial [Candidatus Thermoplasmatota archaeon]|nr:cation:proton antiporter [Candidatus Thermoplasmatota archaeon]
MADDAGILLLEILAIVVAAKLGGEVAVRLRQPAVLGELAVGVLLGSSLLGGYLGMPDFALERQADALADRLSGATDPALLEEGGAFLRDRGAELARLDVLLLLAGLGAILLLFEVGLQSNVREMAKVGASSLLVALIGIVVSFAFGYAASWALATMWAPWHALEATVPPSLLHVFVGATLTATSVGITARVLADMDRLHTREARIILGAAVLDDIGGLLILAVVVALMDAATGGSDVSLVHILRIAAIAVGFVVAATVVGLRLVPRLFDRLVGSFRIPGVAAALAFALALLMAYLASLANLATIVGAFVGGLVLAQAKTAPRVAEGLKPVASLLVGFFFVTLGMRVDLTAMKGHGPAVLAIGAVLTVVAILTKLACGWG